MMMMMMMNKATMKRKFIAFVDDDRKRMAKFFVKTMTMMTLMVTIKTMTSMMT